MVTDAQVRRLMKLIQTEETLAIAASKAGIDEKTARKYRDTGQLPSQTKVEHTWRTRPDCFEEVWPDLQQMLELNDGLEGRWCMARNVVRFPVAESRSSNFDAGGHSKQRHSVENLAANLHFYPLPF